MQSRADRLIDVQRTWISRFTETSPYHMEFHLITCTCNSLC